MSDKSFPLTKGQEKVLSVLGMSARDYSDADNKLGAIGLSVSSKRGVPTVRYHSVYGELADSKTVSILTNLGWFQE